MVDVSVGILELAMTTTVGAGLLISGESTRKWAVVVLPILLFAMLLTPADILSTVFVSVPLLATLFAGVWLSAWLRPTVS